MNIRFFTLLYIAATPEKSALNGKKIGGEERILVYLRNCNVLNLSLKINGFSSGLTILTNKKKYIDELRSKYNLSFELEEIFFDLQVPLNIGFYSAHFKIDAYRYLGRLTNQYSFLLDNDVVCLSKMPNHMKELIEKHIAVHYAFPIYRVEHHNIGIMKYIEPSIITGEWSGGEFLGGNADFYKQLYNEISSFVNRYFSKMDEMFHQGDEMLTSIAIEKMKLNGWKITDGGVVDLIYRFYSISENVTIDKYKSWMNHLICDKYFLANLNTKKYGTNEDFIKMYNQYFHTTMKIKRIYYDIKKRLS